MHKTKIPMSKSDYVGNARTNCIIYMLKQPKPGSKKTAEITFTNMLKA